MAANRKVNDYGGDLIKTSHGAKTPMKTLGRLLKYSFLRNKFATICVIIFVCISSVANVTAASRVSVITTELIDNQMNADMGLIMSNIIMMGCIYAAGAI